MQSSDLENKVLDALIAYFRDWNTTGTLNENDLGELARLGVPAAIARPCLARFQERGLLVRRQDSGVLSRPGTQGSIASGGLFSQARDALSETVQGPPYWELTLEGAELFQSRSEANALSTGEVEAAGAVPVADRFVASTDNGVAFAEAKGALAELRKAVQDSNEFPITGEDRLAVVREIESVEQLVSGTKVRAAAVWQATRNNAALGWLTKEGGSGTVRALAAQAVTWLLKAVGLG